MTFLLFSPLLWALASALLLALAWRSGGRTPLRRALRLSAGAGLAAACALCTPLGANLLVRTVEAGVPAAARCAGDDTAPLVVLSGGYERAPRALDDYAALTTESWRRLRGAVELWRRQPAATLWIVGGGVDRVAESRMQARLAMDWGVPAGALRIEAASTTTWEGAFALRPLLPGRGRVRLATSAIHLPRARIAFAAAGIEACAVATDSDYVSPRGPGVLVPQATAIEKASIAAYELVGLAWYALRAQAAGSGVAASAGDAGAAADRPDTADGAPVATPPGSAA